MVPIIGAMISLSSKFPLISCFENSACIFDPHKIPQNIDEYRFGDIDPDVAKMFKWIVFFDDVLQKNNALYKELYEKKDLAQEFSQFAYEIMLFVKKHKKYIYNYKSIYYDETDEIFYYNIEKLFGFHFIQYVSRLTYDAMCKEISKDSSLNIQDLLYIIIKNKFSQLISEIYNGYGVYSRLRIAQEYIPKFVKEAKFHEYISSEYGYYKHSIVIEQIKKRNTTLIKASNDLFLAHKYYNNEYELNIKNFKTKETDDLKAFYDQISKDVDKKISDSDLFNELEQNADGKNTISKDRDNNCKECKNDDNDATESSIKTNQILKTLNFWATHAVTFAKTI